MPAFGKGKATSYTDFYKGKDKTLDDHESEINDYRSEDPEDRKKLKGIGLADKAGDKLRKEALKRRLARNKKAGKQ